MPSGVITLIIMIGSMFALFIIISTVGNYYSLNRIKNKTVGQGQYGTARWANKKEIKRTYKHINFQPNKWRKNPKSRPTQQGIVVGCKNRTIGRLINLANKVFYSFRKFRNLFRKKKNKKVIALKEPVSTTTAMVDTGDVHALMIGATGVGKTAYWLYPCIEYACATGMSFLCSNTKGDIVRNYGTIAEKYYGYKISVIDLRNPTRSHGNNLLHLVNKYMDLYKAEPEQLVYKARAEKYAKIISKTIIQSFAQLEKNYGKDGADVIIDNTQLTIFGGFAPNSTSAEVLSKALGSKTVMSGSVSRSKNDPSQSLQMIERPLMTPDELKSLPKGTFVVMKTGFYPMKVKLKLFFKWGIKFEEKYEVMENGNREVHYANRSELFNNIIQTYCHHYLEQTVTDSDFDEASGEKKKKNENLKTSPNAEQADSGNTIDSEQKYEPTEEPENSSVEQNRNKQGKVVVRTERPPQGDNSNE